MWDPLFKKQKNVPSKVHIILVLIFILCKVSFKCKEIRTFNSYEESLKLHNSYFMACPWSLFLKLAGRDKHGQTQKGREERRPYSQLQEPAGGGPLNLGVIAASTDPQGALLKSCLMQSPQLGTESSL